jgi:hypothetical protein
VGLTFWHNLIMVYFDILFYTWLSLKGEKPAADAEKPAAGEIDGQDLKNLPLSKEIIERLKFTVFGFDTFFVTSVEVWQSKMIKQILHDAT